MEEYTSRKSVLRFTKLDTIFKKRRLMFLNFAIGRPRLGKRVIFRSYNWSRGIVRLRTVSGHQFHVCALTATALRMYCTYKYT